MSNSVLETLHSKREGSLHIQKLLSRGSIWALAGQAGAAGASLIATPFTVRLLGPEQYGILALIGVLLGYAGFSDLGMAQASVRFAAEAYSSQDVRREAAVIWTSILVLAGPVALVALLMVQHSQAIAAMIYGQRVAAAGEAIVALKLAAAIVVLRALAGVLYAPPLVRLRIPAYTAVSSGSAIAQTLLTPLALLAGTGLTGALFGSALVAVASVVVSAALAHRWLPAISRPVISAGLVWPLLKFGAGVASFALAAMILSGAERLLLPRYSSLTALAHFSIAFGAVGVILALAGALQGPLFAAFSRLAQSDTEELRRLYLRIVRIGAVAVPLVFALCCVSARPLFAVWAGREYAEHSAVPFYILSVGATINVLAKVPLTLITAMGRIDLGVRLQFAALIPYLICSVFLISRYGAAGAAIAWSVRTSIDGAFLFFMAPRTIKAAVVAVTPAAQAQACHI